MWVKDGSAVLRPEFGMDGSVLLGSEMNIFVLWTGAEMDCSVLGPVPRRAGSALIAGMGMHLIDST